MAAGKRSGSSGRSGGVTWSEDGDGEDVDDPASAVASLLDGLDECAEVCIWREQPNYAAGFIGTWELYDRDPVSFLQRLQAECGGSVFRIRPLRRESNGRKLYAPGSRRIRISGPPLTEGRPYHDHGAPPPRVIDATAVSRPSTPAAPAPEGLQGLLAVLNQIGSRLATLEARASLPAPASSNPSPLGGFQQQQQDPLATTLATLKQLSQINRYVNGGAPDDDDDDDDGDDEPASLEDLLLGALAKKLDGDDKPAPASTTAPSGPRLIRNGEDVTATSSTPATPSPDTAEASSAEPQTAHEGARAVADKLASLDPAEAVAFLQEVTAALPPELQAGLVRAAMAQRDGTEG